MAGRCRRLTTADHNKQHQLLMRLRHHRALTMVHHWVFHPPTIWKTLREPHLKQQRHRSHALTKTPMSTLIAPPPGHRGPSLPSIVHRSNGASIAPCPMEDTNLKSLCPPRSGLRYTRNLSWQVWTYYQEKRNKMYVCSQIPARFCATVNKAQEQHVFAMRH